MKKRISVRKVVLLSAMAALLILIVWTIWGNTALMVSAVTVSGSRIPAEFDGFRIAHVSDLHNAEFGEGNVKLLRLISETAPNIIVITGDLADARHTDMDIALGFVREAVRIAPVYYVTGNHEAALPQYGELKSGLEAAGAVVLEDDAVRLEHNDSAITIIGLSDPDFTIKGNGMFHEAPAMVSAKLKSLMEEEGGYTVLLSHRPELFDAYVRCGVDLVLSGHTHGGQFRLPMIGGVIAPNQGLFPKYDAGVYTSGGTSMVVSRGLGNSIIPIRFNNRPEVVLIELSAV
ncbi:MAG: metallophosphoesterase [Roseburia sp.]|nr:metallophosphoesterase [Roseburia sp.]